MEKQRYTPEEAMVEAGLLNEKMVEGQKSGDSMDYGQAELLVEIENKTNPRIKVEGRSVAPLHGLSSETSTAYLQAEYTRRAKEIQNLSEPDQIKAKQELEDELYGADFVIRIGGGAVSNFLSKWNRIASQEIKNNPEANIRALLGAAKESLSLGYTVQGMDLLRKVAEARGVETSVVGAELGGIIENSAHELINNLHKARDIEKELKEKRKNGETVTSDEWNRPGGFSIIGLEQAIKTMAYRLPEFGFEDLAGALKTQINPYS